MSTSQGRRRDDIPLGDLPYDVQPGDYWKYLKRDGSGPIHHEEAGNLTGTAWGFSAPNGCGIGTLMKHTVRENDDGTATIAPGDGSTNSVLINGSDGRSWHGFLEHGVWRSV